MNPAGPGKTPDVLRPKWPAARIKVLAVSAAVALAFLAALPVALNLVFPFPAGRIEEASHGGSATGRPRARPSTWSSPVSSRERADGGDSGLCGSGRSPARSS